MPMMDVLDQTLKGEALPRIDIITSVRNEAHYLPGKLENLRALAYPPDLLRFWIVDGASTDGSAALVRQAAGADERFRLLCHATPNKAAQINLAVSQCDAEFVIVSDADALLGPGAVRQIAEVFRAQLSVGVVGVTVSPSNVHPLEHLHWRLTNALRRFEARRFGVTCVTAPCYAVRRSVLEPLPEDVVADDIHIAFAAAARGWRVAIIDADVTELRGPADLTGLLHQKRRKARAGLRELFRSLGRSFQAHPRAQALFAWRFTQLVVGPLLVVALLLGGLAGMAMWSAEMLWDAVTPQTFAAMMAASLTAGFLVRSAGKGRFLHGIASGILLFTIVHAGLLLALLTGQRPASRATPSSSSRAGATTQRRQVVDRGIRART